MCRDVIIVADDEEPIRFAMCDLFSRLGYDVFEASDGAAVRRLIGSGAGT